MHLPSVFRNSLIAGTALALGLALAACASDTHPPVTTTSRYTLASAPPSSACLSCGFLAAIKPASGNGYLATVIMEDGTKTIVRLNDKPAFSPGDWVQLVPRQ